MTDSPLSFQEAVQLAKETIGHFQRVRSTSGRVVDETDPVASANAFAGRLGAIYLRDEKRSAQLLRDAETDWQAFNRLRHGLALLLEHDKLEMRPEVRDWLSRYLRGEVSAPVKKAGRKQTPGPHIVIEWCVSLLVDKGMNATRNYVSPPESACDAVAKALAELGMKPTTFGAVKRIYLDRRRFVHRAP